MEISVYRTYKKIGAISKKSNLIVCRPEEFISLRQLVNMIEKGRSYEFMFLAYHEQIADLIDPELYAKYVPVTRELFDKNPKQFGILCYKDKNGRLSFK